MITSSLRVPAQPTATFATADVDGANEFYSAVYKSEIVAAALRPEQPFTMRSDATFLGAVTLVRTRIANWSIKRQTRNSVGLIVPLRNVLRKDAGARARDHAPGKLFAVSRPYSQHQFQVERGEGLSIAVPVGALVARVERLSGQACNDTMLSRMVETVPARSPIGQALARTAMVALTEISAAHRLGHATSLAQGYEELLVNLISAALFPEIAEEEARTLDAGPIAIRKARDFMRAHAAETVEISAIAADLGLSMRALQENFCRYYNFSPRDYLTECRLELAREMLLAPNLETSVLRVALASGFTDQSRFAAKYRDKYGEAPAETLRLSGAA